MIACLRSPPSWFGGRWLRFTRAPSCGPRAPRPRPRQFPSCSQSAATLSRLGLVTSLNRPDGNLTGMTIFFGELLPKRLELLRELMPAADAHRPARQSEQSEFRGTLERCAGGRARDRTEYPRSSAPAANAMFVAAFATLVQQRAGALDRQSTIRFSVASASKSWRWPHAMRCPRFTHSAWTP